MAFQLHAFLRGAAGLETNPLKRIKSLDDKALPKCVSKAPFHFYRGGGVPETNSETNPEASGLTARLVIRPATPRPSAYVRPPVQGTHHAPRDDATSRGA